MNAIDREKVLARFWAKVNKSGPSHPTLGTSCWLWTARSVVDGYGRIKVGAAMRMAHRVSFEIAGGVIPAGLELDHLCRNRACVNPAHLEPVTHKQNMDRSPLAGPAHNRAKTMCPAGHEYTGINSRGGRVCRACLVAAKARYRARLRAAGVS